MLLANQVEVENYTGAYSIDGIPGRGSWKPCSVEIQRAGDMCSVLLRNADGILFGTITGVARSNSCEGPERGLPGIQIIPDNTADNS